jgi:Asp-tRNA(Asn)/Glu-tRNA(Gln) amidotransferase A subunit family amidase
MTQNNLGNALRVLGDRGDDEALRRAVAAFEAALDERTRERTPLDWAATQNNLGNALAVLGQRGDDEALRRAVAAYEAALEERTRERAPLAWAATQNNLGNPLQVLGKRGDDEALRRAVRPMRQPSRNARASACRSPGRGRTTISALRSRRSASAAMTRCCAAA